MKKYIGLIGLGLMLSTQSVATTWTDANCTNRGGTIKIAQNGQKFCFSNKPMNWWSANVWCQRHDGQLVNIASWCPGTAVKGGELCANYSLDRFWLRDVTSSSSNAFHEFKGTLYTEGLSFTSRPIFALCE